MGDRPTIGLSMIVRNGGEALRQCLASVVDVVDEVCVVITHPDEQPDAIADADEAIVLSFAQWSADHPVPDVAVRYFRWVDDFAAARQVAYDMVRSDWLLWLDHDDLLVGDPRAVVAALDPDVAGVMAPYEYAFLDGQPVTVFDRERLVRKAEGWYWADPVHETLHCQQDVGWARTDEVRVVHTRADDQGESARRNLAILLKWYEREPANVRLKWHLGNQYFALADWPQAIHWFKAYADVSDTAHEKWLACCYLARAYARLGQWKYAKGAALRALAVEPDWFDPYLLLAETALNEGQPAQALAYLKHAEQAIDPPSYVFQNPLYRAFDLLVIKSLALGEVGLIAEALAACEAALAVRPADTLLADRVRYRELLRTEQSRQAALWLYEDLARHDETQKAAELHRFLPYTLRQDPAVLAARERAAAQVAHLQSLDAYKHFYQTKPEWQEFESRHPELLPRVCRINWLHERLAKCGARSVLDIGCSDGYVAVAAAQAGAVVVGIDVDPRAIAAAKARAVAAGVADRCHFYVGLWEEIDHAALAEQHGLVRFDAAVLGEILEHVPNPQGFLGKVEEICDRVLLTVPNGSLLYGELPEDEYAVAGPREHVRAFTYQTLEVLLASWPNRRILELHSPVGGDGRWLVAEYDLKRDWSAKRVHIYCGLSIEPWGPWSVHEGGIGGSETAVIQLSQQLTACGYQVFVHAMAHGVYDGVIYRDAAAFEPRNAHLWVSWRNPQHVLANAEGSHEQAWLWVHDWTIGDRLTPELAAQYDKILVLSKAHRQGMAEAYPFAADKLVLTANGIDPARFEGLAVVRNPKQVIWPSSPDRGLDSLLEHVWPQVRAQVPDAELVVAYGMQNAEWAARQLPELATRIELTKRLLDQPGVRSVGRVDQATLARLFAESAVWVHPSWYAAQDRPFRETFCIGALEAQAAGCYPVVAPHGALLETVHTGLFLPSGPGKWDRWVRELVRLLTDGVPLGARAQAAMVAWARQQSWAKVARQWDGWLQETREPLMAVGEGQDGVAAAH